MDFKKYVSFVANREEQRKLKILDIPLAGLTNLISVTEAYIVNGLLCLFLGYFSNFDEDNREELEDIAKDGIWKFLALNTIFVLFFGTMVNEVIANFSNKELGKNKRIVAQMSEHSGYKLDQIELRRDMYSLIKTRNYPSVYLYQGLTICLVIGMMLTVFVASYSDNILRLMGEDIRITSIMSSMFWLSSLGNILAMCSQLFRSHLLIHEEYIQSALASLIIISSSLIFGLFVIWILQFKFFGFGLSILFYGILSLLVSRRWCTKTFSQKVNGEEKYIYSHHKENYSSIISRGLSSGVFSKDYLNSQMNIYGLNMVPMYCVRERILRIGLECIKAYLNQIPVLISMTYYTRIARYFSSESENLLISKLRVEMIIILLLALSFYSYPRNLICFDAGMLALTAQNNPRFNKSLKDKDEMTIVTQDFWLYFLHYFLYGGVCSFIATLFFIGYKFSTISLIFFYFWTVWMNIFIIGWLRILGWGYLLLFTNAIGELIISPAITVALGAASSGIGVGGFLAVMVLVEAILGILFLVIGARGRAWRNETRINKLNN